MKGGASSHSIIFILLFLSQGFYYFFVKEGTEILCSLLNALGLYNGMDI